MIKIILTAEILRFITSVCSMPVNFTKFEMYKTDEVKVMKYRCERHIKLCVEFNGDIVNCYNQLKEME